MPGPPESPVTLLLERINQGDRSANDELLPMVYAELRDLAGRVFGPRRNGQLLQATALVHEAYLKLLGSTGTRAPWDGRRHFFAVAATAMRRILTDQARSAATSKRGGDQQRITLLNLGQEDAADAGDREDLQLDLLDLNAALEELERASPRIGRIVELRFLAGMTVEEVAQELQVTERAVYKDWRAGRALLRARMRSGSGGDQP